MSRYVNTKGKAILSVAICARCSIKYPYVDLIPDPNFPGLRVCKKDLDVYDPWRLPARATENITIRYPRPDVSVALDANGNPVSTQNNVR